MSRGGGRPCLECGKRLRKTRHGLPNPNVRCSICNRNHMARLRRAEGRRVSPPVDYDGALDIAQNGMKDAASLGHRMSTLEPDVVRGSFISYCVDCDGFMVVDVNESDKPYGRAATEWCLPHEYLPVPRRSEHQLDWAVSSASLETREIDVIVSKSEVAALLGREG